VPFARHVAEKLGATTDRSGRVAVEPDLSVPGYRNVFVIGDIAGRDGLPGVAENAMQGGWHVAACIRRDIDGRQRKNYRYRDLGSAAYISRGQALLQAGPVKLDGILGWLGWGFIHLAFLTGVRNRFSTVGTWMATIARANRSDRTFILGGSGHPEEPYTWESPVHQGHHTTRGSDQQQKVQ
jgi:NADH dehydrogenase